MANEKFKVKFGLAVGDTVATIDAATGDIVTNGDLTVTGGDITTSATTASVFNTTATTLNIGGAATTAVNIGNASGTVNIPGNLTVSGTTTTLDTANLLVEDKNITIGNVAPPTDITAAGGGITLLGDTNKTITWNNATDGWEFNQPIKVTGSAVLSGDLAVNGGDITTSAGTGTVFNTTATIVNIGGAATTVSIGANTGTTTINNSLVADDISITTVDTTNLEVTNIKANDGTAAMSIADTTGVVTVSTQLNVDNINVNTNTISSTNTNGNITLDPNGTGVVVVSSDLQVTGQNISSGATDAVIVMDRTTASTNVARNALSLQTTSTGTPAVGFGSQLAFQGQTAVSTFKEAGFINVNSTNIGVGSESFEMDFGLMLNNATVATKMTLDSNGNLTTTGDLAVNGGDITTTQTTASVFNTTATTLNIGGAATTTNIGATTGSSIINGVNRFTSPTVYGFLGGATSPGRGYMQSNGNTGSFASARNNMLIRTFPTATATSARGGLIFENARGNETTPVALATNDLIGELSATGYATNGYVGDFVSATPGTSFFTATETWVNTGGPYPTAGTVTNAGTGYIVSLQPTATTVTTANGSRINVLNINPQTFTCRSDSFTWSNGKTGSTQRMSLDVSGNLIVSANISTQNGGISSSSAFDSNEALSSTANLLSTNNQAGSSVGITTKYWTDSTKTTLVLPQSGNKLGNFRFNSYQDTSATFALGAQVLTEATENWTSTANGSRIIFLANKQGQNWSTGHTGVISAAPESASITSDIITLESSAGNDYLVLNGSTATLKNTAGNPLTGNNISYGRVYGQFQYDTTVTPVAADTAYVFPLGTADINNIATVGSTSRLIAGAAGIYNLQFSIQVDNADNSNDHDAYIWLRKNGSDVTGSMGRTTVTKNNAGSLKIIAWNYIVSSANTTDYWEIAYAVSDTDVTFPAFAATAFGPTTACIITSLTPVGA